MINEFINIVYRSTRFDKNFYSNSKNFDEAAIYFAAIIIIVVGILGIIPQAAILEFYRNNFNVDVPITKLKYILIVSIFIWIIRSIYIFIVGIKLFPSKKTNCNLLKVFTLVGFAHSPYIFRFVAFSNELILPVIILTEILYHISLIIGTNEILNYKNIFKSFMVIEFPLILLIIYIFLNWK